MEASEACAPCALNIQPKLSKTQEVDTDKQLREALECDDNLQRMMETLMSQSKEEGQA